MLPQKITKELVVASLISETTRLNLQTLLEQAKSIRYDRDALSSNYDLLLKLRGIWDYLDKRRKEEDKVEKDIIATRKSGYDEIMNPIAELLDAADPHLFALNTEVLLEEKVIGDAIKKQISTRDALAEFINDTIRIIIGAPDNKELIRIQKSIGSEKSHKTKYGEYASLLEGICDELLELINGRKKLISENSKLQEQLDKAILGNDEPAKVHITELMEIGKRELEENAASISDNAIQKISSLPIIGYDAVSKAIKPRTHRWSWRVDNMELLYKKYPEFVVKEANTKAINAFMKEKSESEELDEYKENNFSGLVLYRKPFYVAVKTQKDA
jgi:hypothetical protein